MTVQRTNVEGLGDIVTSIGNLATNVQELGRIISIRDDAYARIHSDIGKTEGTRVSMIVDYLNGEMPVLVRNGMNQRLAESLVNANSQNKYYSTGSAEQYEKARKTADNEVKSGIVPENRKAIMCPSRDVFSMSLTENPEHLNFVFQDVAKEYFEKNGEPIKFLPIHSGTVDASDGTIQNYIWFRCLDVASELLGGDSRNASNCYNGARGVSRVLDAPKAPRKISALPYTQSKLSEILNILEGIKQGKVKISDLESEVEKVSEFLQRLKQ